MEQLHIPSPLVKAAFHDSDIDTDVVVGVVECGLYDTEIAHRFGLHVNGQVGKRRIHV